jgi:hypothetical protein
MRKHFAIIIGLLSIGSLMSSCRTAPQVIATNVNNLEKAVQAEKVVIVSSAGEINGKRFRECFIDELTRLTQGSKKKLSIMTDSEFARSAYNQPERKDSLNEMLFIFVKVDSHQPGEYGTHNVKYLIEVKYVDQAPFLSQEIRLGIGNTAVHARFWSGIELARTVFEELNKRNIL